MTEGTQAPPRPAISDQAVLGALLKRLLSRRRLTEKDFGTVVDITIEKVVEAVDAEGITLYRVDADGIRFDRVHYSPSLYHGDKELAERYRNRAEQLQALTLPLGKGIVGRAIAEGNASLVADVKADPDFKGDVDAETGFETRSMMTVPLMVDDRAIGAIQTLNKRSGNGHFTEDDLRLLEEVTRYSAKILARVRDPEMESDENEMAEYVARLTGNEVLDLSRDFEPDEKLWNLIGEPDLRRFRILPIKKTGSESVDVVMANPLDLQKRDSFELSTGLRIDGVAIATESAIEGAIDGVYRPSGEVGDVAKLVENEYAAGAEAVSIDSEADEDSAPIVQLANRIIEDAYSRGASDIHIEPFETEVLVRYRVDGILSEQLRLPSGSSRALIARLKIMSDLDISERRLPQDGRIRFKRFSKTGVDIDLRVSTGPMSWGEKICMRILDKTNTSLGLNQMGFSEKNLKLYRRQIEQPYGMILHVGPTGSGKTTTLYAALQEILSPEINIQTAEDPVEYQLKGVNQMQMHADIGLTFASALRCFLRQDPDVILVGEMRDLETAAIGIEAALTGHLLFSTLHTNDAPGTITRFLDMGIEPFLISSSLLCVCAQRLMRRLCAKCKESYVAVGEELESLGVEPGTEVELCRPKGCPACNDTGYKGRLGIHELMTMNDTLRGLIVERAPSEKIKAAAVENGMTTLYWDAIEKVRQGVTSLEEALVTVRKD